LDGNVIPSPDHVALIDLDGTVADCDGALQEAMKLLQAPEEPLYQDRYSGGIEPPYIEMRRKLIQRQPGFWRNLKPIPRGFEVVHELRQAGFSLHVLTKGPQKNGAAWGEKLEWAHVHLPDAVVTVTGDKSLVYGRILFDDFPPYFTAWLKVRPRGLVICLAHPWNKDFAPGGKSAQPNILRYDGDTVHLEDLQMAIWRAYQREPREAL
jgi:5'(3')-deoxyribonucleotidase